MSACGADAPALPQRAGTSAPNPATSPDEPPRLPTVRIPGQTSLVSLPDGDIPFSCTTLRSEIAARRSQQQFAPDADAEALRMLNEAPHQYVAPNLLVDFLMPAIGQGRATGGPENEQKTLVMMSLCDQLYREIVTRQFVAANPSYR
ncbi:MAG: hypothetical protein Q8Q09_18690 [Deltaproteobacteria bacterium]|nr:hypothetical protein [Deltaproteobacteria bacterium]